MSACGSDVAVARFTDADLESLAHHVAYELRMVAVLEEHPHRPEDLPVGNALLESYLIHCRNLHEFLVATSARHPTDVIAADYFDEPERHSPAVFPHWFEISAIHRRVAHLTVERLEGNSPNGFNWGVKALGGRARWGRETVRAFGQFLGDLRTVHPNRAVWFDEPFQMARDFERKRIHGLPLES